MGVRSVFLPNKLKLEFPPTVILKAREPTYDTSIEAVMLRWAVAELPQAYREPLLLQVVGGYSCHEIAELLDISTGAVFTRLFRARQRLLATLAGGDETTH